MMGRTRDEKQDEIFLQAIRDGKKQKEACGMVGWSESKGSRFLSKVKKEEPWRLKKESVSDTGQVVVPLTILQEESKPAKPISVHYITNEQKEEIKKEKKFLNFNMTEYTDYLQTMAGHSRVSVTKYIQGLIEDDMRVNRDKYEKLKSI